MILGMKLRNQDFDTSTSKIIEYKIWLELRIHECYIGNKSQTSHKLDYNCSK